MGWRCLLRRHDGPVFLSQLSLRYRLCAGAGLSVFTPGPLRETRLGRNKNPLRGTVLINDIQPKCATQGTMMDLLLLINP